MKLIVVLITAFLIARQTDYRTEFTFDYDWAVKFMHDNKKLFLDKSHTYGTDTAILTSVVFPEIIRFSIFKNYFETKGLELIYVKHGKEYADYSIGYFQMKPSFVEMLEDYVIRSDSLNKIYSHITIFNQGKPEKIRSERLERIKSLEWQIEYLNCFYTIVSERFPDIELRNKEDRIRFYATAYNHGLDRPADEIHQWMDVAVFPYGIHSKARQYKYSDISVHFYRKEFKRIFTN